MLENGLGPVKTHRMAFDDSGSVCAALLFPSKYDIRPLCKHLCAVPAHVHRLAMCTYKSALY